MFDIYHHLKNNPSYSHKLVGSDYLFVEYKCPIDVELFRFKTDLNFITYVVSGRKDWITPGHTFAARAGDALFVRKGVHTVRQYFDEDHCVLTFFVDDDFIRNFMRENASLAVAQADEKPAEDILPIDVNTPLKDLFTTMFHYLAMGTAIPRNLVELKFKELLFNLILNPKNSGLSALFSFLNHTGKANLDYVMSRNFRYELQLEEFARLSGRSLSAFKRDFKTYYGQSPAKWLNEKRLEYARTMLLHSDRNVNEICYESGFRNASHFNRAFRAKYHLPPRQFRTQNAAHLPEGHSHASE